MPSDFQYYVFLSHNHADKPRVRRLAPVSQLSTLNSLPSAALKRSTAVPRDPANVGRRFIPLLLGDCDLPDTLRRYKYVDFREESEAAFAEVSATLRETLLPKLLSGELSVASFEKEVPA